MQKPRLHLHQICSINVSISEFAKNTVLLYEKNLNEICVCGQVNVYMMCMAKYICVQMVYMYPYMYVEDEKHKLLYLIGNGRHFK